MLNDTLISAYRLLQISTSKDNLHRAHPGIRHYKNACTKRICFKAFLLKLSEALIRTQTDTAQTHRAQPEDELVDFQARPLRSDIPLIQVTAGGESFGNTPQRTVSKMYDRISDTPQYQRTMIEQHILDRKNHCSGAIIRIDEKATNAILKRHKTMRNRTDIPNIVAPLGTCILCNKKQVSFYCIGCHQYFCVGTRCKTLQCKEKIAISFPNHTPTKRKSSTAISVADCFSICHPNSYGGPNVFDKIVNELSNKEQAKVLQPERVTTRSVSSKRGTTRTRRMVRQQRATTQGAVLASTKANQKSAASRVLQLKNNKKKRKQNNRSDHGNKRKK